MVSYHLFTGVSKYCFHLSKLGTICNCVFLSENLFGGSHYTIRFVKKHTMSNLFTIVISEPSMIFAEATALYLLNR